jgi:hypothetical protein
MYGDRQGSGMAAILNPTNGYRGSLQKQGVKPKNHMAANRAALKAKEQEFKDNIDKMSVTSKCQFVRSFANFLC